MNDASLGTKFTRDGSKFEQTAPRGAQTQNFYTCSGRFPAITTIKDIHPCAQGNIEATDLGALRYVCNFGDPHRMRAPPG